MSGSRWLLFVLMCAASRIMAAPIDETPKVVEPPKIEDAVDSPAPRVTPEQPPTPRPRPQTGGNVWARDARLQGPQVALARRAMHSGNVEECLRHLTEAVEEDPQMLPPNLGLAFLYLSEGRVEEAKGALDRAAVKERFHPEVFLTCGQLALLEDRRYDAQVHFEQALRLEKPSVWPEAQQRGLAINALAGLAEIAQRRQDWFGAAVVMNKWVALQPGDAQLLDRFGMALCLSGERDKALEIFTASYKLDPKMSPPELSMAATCVKANDFSEATSWYHKALEKYPDDGRPHFEFGSALLVEGRVDEAKEHLDKAVEAGDKLDVPATEVALMRGFLARARGEFPEAEKHFTHVRRKSPGNAVALQQLVAVLVEQPEEAKRKTALQIAQFQAKQQPTSPAAQATLAWVYYRLGRKDEALAALSKAVLPRDKESLYYAARVLFEYGEPEQARPAILALQAALDKPGLFVLRDEATQWLETALLAIN